MIMQRAEQIGDFDQFKEARQEDDGEDENPDGKAIEGTVSAKITSNKAIINTQEFSVENDKNQDGQQVENIDDDGQIDANIEFVSLEREHIDMIVDKTINEINEMIKDKNVTIKISDDARTWLRDRGYIPEMGARPLQRVVNDNIKKPISKEILFGKLRDGGTVTVNIDNADKIEFVYT